MTQETVCYFDKTGDENTETTLKLAVETAGKLGIRHIVLATTSGETARILADSIGCRDIAVTAVTHAFGQKIPNANPLCPELRRHLMEKGFNICTAAHALSGAERSLSHTFSGVYPLEIIAHSLRMLGQGTKVCVEICAMAADAGLIPAGEPVVAVAGTGHGADTALILRPEVSCNILSTKIDKIICKPIV